MQTNKNGISNGVNKNFKKLFVSTAVIIATAFYVISRQTNDKPTSDVPLTNTANSAVSAPVSSSKQTAPAATPAPKASVKNIPTPAPKSAIVNQGAYRDGTYTGSVADAYYGYVQVAAVIKNGKIAEVNFLQYPSDRSYSIEVSNYAMPILRTEAIQAQSAKVDIISGATDTSLAFRESLASALSLAKR